MTEYSTELPAQPSAEHRIGRYLVRRRLGAGGFARVYLAWDPDLEIEVAIKVPKPQLADDAEALDRFRREATTAARLRHPNVVTVLTVGRLDEPFDGAPVGTPYLVMDFLPESLSARLAATPMLPEPEWLRIGEEVARGLAYAHAQGVVHRDVKPDNVLFGRHGEAVVTDFGIARAVTERLSSTSRSLVVGTPEYFSPEQARGLPLDGRTDVYALGVTLYRMATGALPFEGADWYAIMRQHVEDTPPSARGRNPALGAGAEDVIRRCLAKKPEDRFQSAAELAACLASVAHPNATGSHAVLDGATVDLGPKSAVAAGRAVATRPRRSRPALVAGTAVGLSGLAMLVALFVRREPGLATPQPTRAAADSLRTPGVNPPPPDTSRSPTTTPTGTLAVTPVKPTTTPASTARGRIAVSAPAGATIFLDGTSTGAGPWADSVTAGTHEVTARVETIPGCPSASKSRTVAVNRGQTNRIALSPLPCGTLTIDRAPPGARYTLTPLSNGGTAEEGRLPLDRELVLPEGSYRLVVEKLACQTYTETVRVQAGAAHVEPAKLFCNPAGN